MQTLVWDLSITADNSWSNPQLLVASATLLNTWLHHSIKVLIQEGKILLKSRTPLYYFCSEMFLMMKCHLGYETVEWWKKKAELLMNECQKSAAWRRAGQTPDFVAVWCPDWISCILQLHRLLRKKGTTVTINQLFHIIHPKTLLVTDFQGNSSHLITVNCVILLCISPSFFWVKVCLHPNWSNCCVPQIICHFADNKIINLNSSHIFLFSLSSCLKVQIKAENRANSCSLSGLTFCDLWEASF